jgi:hypothetical protein
LTKIQIPSISHIHFHLSGKIKSLKKKEKVTERVQN